MINNKRRAFEFYQLAAEQVSVVSNSILKPLLISNKHPFLPSVSLLCPLAQGSLDAWRNLASMHYLGDGVPKSVDLAKEIMKVVFGKK